MKSLELISSSKFEDIGFNPTIKLILFKGYLIIYAE
jgi:hypothetical protein